jgi:hypothetical protein
MNHQRKGIRLSPAEAKLFDQIAANQRPIPIAEICEAMNTTAPSLRVAICRLNKKIAARGYRIRARRRGVYSLTKLILP